MKNPTHSKQSAWQKTAEKNSEKLLMEKMGMSKKEINEVYSKYGVSAIKLVEIMQLSKYQFVYAGRVPGQCEPCHSVASTKLRVVNY